MTAQPPKPSRLAPVLAAALLAATLAATLPAQAAPPDSVTLGMVLEPPNLDPTAGAAAAIDEVVHGNIFEGLTRFGPDGRILPGLAHDWQVDDSGTIWTFHLRSGVRFHDGAAFDADDVVFSLDRARAPDSTNAQKALFAGIDRIEAPDPTTAVIHLRQPDGNFAFNLAWGDAVMLDPASAGGAANAPIGTGPYRLAAWRKGDRVDLVANADYWGPAPAIGKASFRFIPDATAAQAAILAGDIDAFPNFPAPELLPILAADPRFSVIIGTTEGETILAMNNARPPLNNPKLRKAIAHAIDRQAVIDGAMFGYGTPIGTHFAPHNPDYRDLTALSAYDPDLSRQLLAEIGPEAQGLTLRLALPPPTYARRGGEIIAAQLRAVGIATTITNLEWAQWLEQVFRGHDFDLTVISHTEPMDINIYARPDYYFGYAKPEFVALIDQLSATSDARARQEILQAAQTMIAEDYVNAYLFQLAKSGVADARLQGLWANAPTPINDLAALSWRP